MLSRSFAVVLACIVISGCTVGVVAEPPTAPTPPPGVITALLITPPGGGVITVGNVVPITTSGTTPGVGALARYADGTSGYVDATWTSSDTNVITVENTQLIARGRGTAILTATFGGRSDTESFTAEGGIAGRWRGTYVVEQCVANSGSMEEILCNPAGNTRPAGIAPVGAALPFSLEISENGADLTATVAFDPVHGTLTGKNRGSGFFFLQGAVDAQAGNFTVIHWDTLVTRDAMEGFIGYEVRLRGVPGFGTVAARLVNVARQ